jgi:hypothetical protein
VASGGCILLKPWALEVAGGLQGALIEPHGENACIVLFMPRHACGTSRPRPHRPSPVQKAVPRRPWCRVPTGTKRSSAALDEVPPPRYRPTRPSGRGTRWAMKSASGQYRHVRPSRHGTPLTGAGETRENRASGAPLTGAGETRENTVNRASVKK